MVSGQEARQGDGETGTSQGNTIKYDNLLLALCSRLFFFLQVFLQCRFYLNYFTAFGPSFVFVNSTLYWPNNRANL